MDWPPPIRERLSDEASRYSLVFGLLSIPFTVGQYLRGDEVISIASVFWAALLAAYLAGTRPGISKRVGFRTGLVAALPVLWLPVEVVQYYSGVASPLWFEIAAISMVGGTFVVVAGGFFVLVGVLGGKIGGWLAGKTGRRQRPPAAGA